MVFAWGYGEDWDEGDEEVIVPCGAAAGSNGQEKHEGSSHELQLQRGWEPQPLGRSVVERSHVGAESLAQVDRQVC